MTVAVDGMEVALYLTGAAVFAAGLAGIVLPILPGSLLLLAGVALMGWASHFTVIGWPTVIATGVLALVMWAADHLAGVLGARAFGSSRWAMLGGAVGVVVGLFFGLPGIILGPALGAMTFELWKDPNLGRAARAGAGALVGFLVGTVLKVALAFVIVGIVAIALLV
ncbi:MAG: DUF456 domain-containing protein [Anaeromyxobacteraceae bacterium]